MRIRHLAVALGLLVMLAGCMGPLQNGTATGDTTTTGTTISVSGTGSVSTDADLAVVFVSVSADAETADAARGQVATDVEQMRSALRSAGVPDDAVTTTSFSIFQQYDFRDGERVEMGFRATHAFSIETAPASAGEIVDIAVGNGATEVGGVSFTLSEETRSDLRSQAIDQAVTAARADADAMAGAVGLSVTSTQTMSTSGGFIPVERFEQAASDAGGAQTTFEPGPVTVSATVEIMYRAS